MGVPSLQLKTDAKSSELDKVPITLKLLKLKITINLSFAWWLHSELYKQ
jgi:hypothetical protein